MRLDNVKEMSRAEMKSMLNDCAWREVNKLWAEELTDLPKLCVLKEPVGRGFKARCVGVRRKKMRRVLTKLRRGSYSGATGGDGEMERFEEGGQEVY